MPSSVGVAVTDKEEASHRPRGSHNAQVAMASPESKPGSSEACWSPLPAHAHAAAAERLRHEKTMSNRARPSDATIRARTPRPTHIVRAPSKAALRSRETSEWLHQKKLALR